jgi:hypothetical protein
MSNHFIPLTQAVEMTQRYRNEKENILKPEYQGKNILLICETFDRDAFDTLLAQAGCEKLRIYFGMDTTLKVKTITVGVNAQNEDMLPSGSSLTGGGGNNIVEEGLPCPEWCPPPSPLNNDN